MKLISKFFAAVILAPIAALSFQACDKGKSYAELLNDENMAVNRFLCENRVVTSIPADSVFEVGPDAPYYRLAGLEARPATSALHVTTSPITP